MAKYLLFDTETTGASEEDKIIQIGLMIVHNKNEIDVFDELCNSEIPIKLEAMEVHNITPDLLEGKPKFIETKSSANLVKYNESENYLIAHNIKFDLGMLQKENFINKYTLIDTLRCARHLFDDMPYHRLQYLRYALELNKIEESEAKKLGIVIKAHDAIGDVLVMKLLLSKLVQKVGEKYTGINPMIKLAELTNTPVFVKTFKFGKYKGSDVAEVAKKDAGYLLWMRNNMEDLDEDMKFTFFTSTL
ncbi:MAG: 3'-5' exonuclease [Arcobacter sp.]|nr:3'-5' exonuclease [Arcobacter sp.]